MDRLTEMEAFATVVDLGGFTDAARRAEPVGVLRVSAHAEFGRHLSPALGAFLDRHPRLSVCLELASGHNDLVPGGFDVVLRLGDGVAPGLPARSFAETTTRLIAAPAYLARAGRPRRIDELNTGCCTMPKAPRATCGG